MSKNGYISARPRSVEALAGEKTAPAGLQALQLDPARDSYLFVPEGRKQALAPLLLMLHGAGGHAHHGLDPLLELAQTDGVILLAPASRRSTWDVIHGGYGPDVELINQALELVFSRYAIEPNHLGIGGFSDGASYALSLGITNGDLFTHILAYSPGFMAPAARRGSPLVFISHGREDDVLPVKSCSRRIVPQLQQAGYDVRYHEFPDGHTVPAAIARDSLAWFLRQVPVEH